MKLMVEFESGDRNVAKPSFGETREIGELSNESSVTRFTGTFITIKFIAYDPTRRMWLFSDSLFGPWYAADEKILFLIRG